ncbi:hypothetical protein A9Q81_20450 [Gammaproteobacteria bacterium 42_54_T18]|nr:hypothetical protein A9Q81_20450 [Gammaproteobacteria bacterium 42_54_T18]
MKNPGLNVAGRLTEIFIDSKLTPLFIAFCIGFGVIAISLTPKEEIPQLVIPSVKIIIPMPGAEAKEIEKLIVKPVENVVSSISGVKHIFSTVVNGVATIVAEFKVGFDKSQAIVLIHERINSIKGALPITASEAIITGIDIDDVPFYTATLTSKYYDEQQLRSIAEKIGDHLTSLKNVSIIKISGGEKPLIRIILADDKLEFYNISISQIEAAINTSNLSTPIGSLTENREIHSLYLDANIYDTKDLNHIIVARKNNVPIYLQDIAKISKESGNDRKQYSYFSQRISIKTENPNTKGFTPQLPAITLSIAKKKGSNSVDVGSNIDERIGHLKQNLIPNEIDVTITRNNGVRADDAVTNLEINLVLSMVTVILISIIFIGVRESLIIGFTVPLTLSLSLGACYLYGVSINRITLFALILSMGMLVDAATVVIDNIFRNHSSHSTRRLSFVLATNEIGGATNLATIAIILVFASLIVVSGISGQYFFPITFTVPIAMFASLLVAYIVVPWAALRWSHGSNAGNPSAFERHVVAKFSEILRRIISVKKHRRGVLKITLSFILLSSLQLTWQFVRPQGPGGEISPGALSIAVMPKNDTNSFFIALTLPENKPIEETQIIANEIVDILELNAFVVNYQVFLGQSGPEDFIALIRGFSPRRSENYAEIRVNLTDKKLRNATSYEIVGSLRPAIDELLSQYPNTRIQLVEDPAGPPSKAMILAEVYGSNEKKLKSLTENVKKEFSNTWGITEVFDSYPQKTNEIRFIIDREKAQYTGVSIPEIAKKLRTLSYGITSGIIHDPREDDQVIIHLESTQKGKLSPNSLSMITIGNSTGKRIPLSELVNIQYGYEPMLLHRKDGERVAYVGAELTGSAPIFAVLDINSRLNDLFSDNALNVTTGNLGLLEEVPDTTQGEKVLWQGETRISLTMFRDLAGAFIIAISMVFALLVAYYQSFSLPFIAMAAIPLAIIGVFPGHWLMGAPFSGPSLIGIIALAGIVMRNSLLIIDFFSTQLHSGLPVQDALVKATSMRLPAISLTASTIVIGSMFMLSDPVFQGLAISMIFGTISATLLTPFIIPILVNRYVRINGIEIFSRVQG